MKYTEIHNGIEYEMEVISYDDAPSEPVAITSQDSLSIFNNN